ncbi:TPA: LysM peptidoglycan-binding domain-containing protein [Stenotrophomonas maltophilia]
MQSGGWNGGAAICIRDPTYADKHYFEFDPATFAVTNGVWAANNTSDPCVADTSGQVYRAWAQQIKKFAEDKAGYKVVVSSGDSLWRLAEEAYGFGSHWVALASANELQIAPDVRLQPGQLIYVPRPSLLYDADAPSVILRGSSLWKEWKLAATTCPAGTVRISWEELTQNLDLGEGKSYQGERPEMCRAPSETSMPIPSAD